MSVTLCGLPQMMKLAERRLTVLMAICTSLGKDPRWLFHSLDDAACFDCHTMLLTRYETALIVAFCADCILCFGQPGTSDHISI